MGVPRLVLLIRKFLILIVNGVGIVVRGLELMFMNMLEIWELWFIVNVLFGMLLIPVLPGLLHLEFNFWLQVFEVRLLYLKYWLLLGLLFHEVELLFPEIYFQLLLELLLLRF